MNELIVPPRLTGLGCFAKLAMSLKNYLWGGSMSVK